MNPEHISVYLKSSLWSLSLSAHPTHVQILLVWPSTHTHSLATLAASASTTLFRTTLTSLLGCCYSFPAGLPACALVSLSQQAPFKIGQHILLLLLKNLSVLLGVKAKFLARAIASSRLSPLPLWPHLPLPSPTVSAPAHLASSWLLEQVSRVFAFAAGPLHMLLHLPAILLLQSPYCLFPHLLQVFSPMSFFQWRLFWSFFEKLKPLHTAPLFAALFFTIELLILIHTYTHTHRSAIYLSYFFICLPLTSAFQSSIWGSC